MTRSRDFTMVPSFSDDTPRAGPRKFHAPEEQLTRKDPQKWALGLGLAGLLLASWATASPIVCAEPLDVDLTECSGVFGDGKATVRLPGYCWTGCAGNKSSWVLTTLGLAVLGQTVVVVLNDGSFKNVCALSWYFDLYDQLVQSDQMVDNARSQLGSSLDSQEARLGYFQRTLLRFARRQIESRLEEPALQARSIGESVTTSRVHRLTSAVGASDLAGKCFFLSSLQLVLIFVFDFSMRHSRFRCEGNGKTVEKAAELLTNHGALTSLIVSIACVLLASFLVGRAKWAVHVKVCPEQQDDCGPCCRLLKQFTGKPLRPNLRALENDFLVLKCVPGKELVGVRSRSVLYEGIALDQIVSGETELELEGGEEVVLLFRDFEDQGKQASKGWTHRKVAARILMCACLSLWLASMCCWTCVQAINVPASPEISVADLHERLLLMGACGRHAAIGTSSMLGSMALAIAAVEQVLIKRHSAENTGEQTEESLHDDSEEQLIRPLLDFRRHGDLNVAEYEEAFGQEEDDEVDDDKVADVMSYVWVVSRDGTEQPVNCRSLAFAPRGDSTPRELRSLREQSWQRSKLPRKVRLVKLSDRLRQQMCAGLPAGMYRKASIAVEILDESSSSGGAIPAPTGTRQLVPPEFIAGSFHMSVNLGPKQACEKVSAATAFAAVLLVMVDLALYFLLTGRGLLLSRTDVLTDSPCVYFEVNASTHGPVWNDNGEDIEFRLSLGPYFSGAGGLLAMVGVLGLRVASDKDRTKLTGCWGCLVLYGRAVVYSFSVCRSFVQWAARSIPGFFKNCKATCKARTAHGFWG